jgi:hypothetical protein
MCKKAKLLANANNISFPTIHGYDAKKINHFFGTLVANTQALQTMEKMKEVKVLYEVL